MKKIKMLGFVLVCGLMLSACSNSNTQSEVSQSTPQSSEVKEAEPTKKTTSEVGKRSNPVKLGETATFDTTYYTDGGPLDADRSLTLSNLVR